MSDLAARYENNPIIRPSDVLPSRDGLKVECVLNPGCFRYQGRIGLVLRVAERAEQTSKSLTIVELDHSAPGGIQLKTFDRRDPDLSSDRDPRMVTYRGQTYLTTLSHLRLAWSSDGKEFVVDDHPTLVGQGPAESFGVEDCRVTELDGVYRLTYNAVSIDGVGIGLVTTEDWQTFHHHGMIIPPPNKDCALFPQKIGGQYVALHRPMSTVLGGYDMWMARSPDLVHWGEHECLLRTRRGQWDSSRIGAGAPPIGTELGWLEIYHGADEHLRYCLGALLLDADDPSHVLARSEEPIMEPLLDYELSGFYGNIIFTNGHIVDGDTVTIYYGASDEFVCSATMSLSAILDSLQVHA